MGATSGETEREHVHRRLRAGGADRGVGFRPFVARLARRLDLGGFVSDTPGGVVIEVSGPRALVERFTAQLESEAPPDLRPGALEIEDNPANPRPPERGEEQVFTIRASGSGAQLERAEAPPDLATCDDCRAEVRDPRNRRYRYPFTNCAHCGPRYTITGALPYDRAHTAMARFRLCATCAAEYHDEADRRFGAESIACPECGPRLRLRGRDGEPVPGDPIEAAAVHLVAGGIVALKGLGGFQLAADASMPAAVASLRRRKQRPLQPLPLMVRDLAAARRIVVVNRTEEELLKDPSRPIVLLPRRPESLCAVADEVAPGQWRLGIMLPTTPLHDLLLDAFAALSGGCTVLVMTSGNRSGEPIAMDGAAALSRLANVADLFLDHDRPIVMSAEDSVVRVDADGATVIRRGRGQAPSPVKLGLEAPPVLALGGDLKSAICLTLGGEAFLGPCLGDLAGADCEARLEETVDGLVRLLGARPSAVAVDLDPGARATRMGRARAEAKELPVIPVQHHHAHVVSCMVDNGLMGPVIGLALDGGGYGPDGTVWGGELLVADRFAFTRAGHLTAVPLPGGAAAAEEPWRMAVSHLHQAFGAASRRHASSLLADVDPLHLDAAAALVEDGGDRVPLTSSAGVLFDAVAALLGLTTENRFALEGAMALENALAGDLPGQAGGGREEPYEPEVEGEGEVAFLLRTEPLVRGVVADIAAGVGKAEVNRRFHLSLAALLAAGCERVRALTGLGDVALSGGVFQNVFFTGELARRLRARGFRVLRHQRVPPADGGIALGQAAVAAARLVSCEGREGEDA
jgi:hydrogenase maturation protein HypF